MRCVSVGAAILRGRPVPYKQRNSVYSEAGLYHRGSEGRGKRWYKGELHKPVTRKILQRDFIGGLGKTFEWMSSIRKLHLVEEEEFGTVKYSHWHLYLKVFVNGTAPYREILLAERGENAEWRFHCGKKGSEWWKSSLRSRERGHTEIMNFTLKTIIWNSLGETTTTVVTSCRGRLKKIKWEGREDENQRLGENKNNGGKGEACGDREMGNLSVKNGSTGTEVGNRTQHGRLRGRLRQRRRRLKQQKERKERKRVRRLDLRGKKITWLKKKRRTNETLVIITFTLHQAFLLKKKGILTNWCFLYINRYNFESS